MSVKTIKVEDDVRNAIRNAEWSENQVNLGPPGSLSRDLYVRTNRVLESFGFKWDKKAKAHVGTLSRLELEAAISGDSVVDIVKTDKEKFQFFPTIPEVAALMVSNAIRYAPAWRIGMPPVRILEPSAGDGAIVRAIHEGKIGHLETEVDAIELDERHAPSLNKLRNDGVLNRVFIDDFMHCDGREEYDIILMNPPFSKFRDIEHVHHAITRFLRRGGICVSLMSCMTLEKRSRKVDKLYGELRDVTTIRHKHLNIEAGAKTSAKSNMFVWEKQ